MSCSNIIFVWGIKADAAGKQMCKCHPGNVAVTYVFIFSERAALIEVAISEAKEHASKVHTESSKPATVQRHQAFKLAYPETLAQGKARLLFEDMISRAEKKILQSRRIANTASLEKNSCLLYTSPSPRDATLSRMPSSA